MTNNSPIWPAQLDHLRLNSDDPAMLADYYATVFGYHQSDLPEGRFLLQGPGRRLVIGGGASGERPYHGYRLQGRQQLDEVRSYLQGKGLNTEPSPSEIFEDDAVAVRDPDGWLNVFGLARRDLPSQKAVNVPSACSSAEREVCVVLPSRP